MGAVHQLTVRDIGPTVIAFQPDLLHEDDDSDDEGYPVRRSTKKIMKKKENESRSSRFMRHVANESDQDRTATGNSTTSSSED